MFLIEDTDVSKGFGYFSGLMCGKVTCISEVNLTAQCDQEWYFIHEKYTHIQE